MSDPFSKKFMFGYVRWRSWFIIAWIFWLRGFSLRFSISLLCINLFIFRGFRISFNN